MKIKLSAALGENLPDTFLDVGSTPTVSTNKKARKGHFLLVEKGRKEATSKNAEEGEGSNPGVRWKEGHPENRSQGAKPAKAAPKASLTAGCSHHFHHLKHLHDEPLRFYRQVPLCYCWLS